MIIKAHQKIVIDSQTKEVSLYVYYKGTGKPEDTHDIIGVSLDGYSFGRVPSLEHIDKFEEMNEILI